MTLETGVALIQYTDWAVAWVTIVWLLGDVWSGIFVRGLIMKVEMGWKNAG